MDKLLGIILSASNTSHDQSGLARKLKDNAENIIRVCKDVDGALSSLSPRDHSVGYTFLLFCKIHNRGTTVSATDPVFYNQACHILTEANPATTHYVIKEFVVIAKFFAKVYLEAMPHAVIRPLYSAITIIQASSVNGPNPSLLTPCHSLYLRACLLGRFYSRALRALGPEIVDISQSENQVTLEECLEYFYYGGRVFTGLKQYTEACHYYRMCICAPASTLSAIVLAAYKKYVLVSLLSTGRPSDVLRSKLVSSSVQRSIKSFSEVYSEFTTAFMSGDAATLRVLIDERRAVLTVDGNLGLAEQCLSHLVRRRIQKLSLTFLTLSLDDIAKQIDLSSGQEAEMYIMRMVEDGQISATISQSDGTVSFNEAEAEREDDAKSIEKMNRDISRFITLQHKLDEVAKTIELSEEYLSQNMEQGQGNGHGQKSFDSLFPMDIEGFDDFAGYGYMD